MELKKASDFDQELLNLFDQYVHGDIDRRGFIDRAGKFAVGGMTAGMLLDALNPKFAEAQQVAKDDKRIKTELVEYPSPQGYGKMRGYLVRPAGATGKLPAILVVHENRGLNPHIEDIARRLALDNFVAAAGYLKGRPDSTGKVGVVGFCFGGGIANMLATRVPDLGAAVPFYGGQPAAADAAKIKAPLLIHYAENDERINAGWPAYEAALKAANVPYTMHMYPGAQHGFNNDTTPRYDPAAAKLAWERTVAFFKKHLA